MGIYQKKPSGSNTPKTTRKNPNQAKPTPLPLGKIFLFFWILMLVNYLVVNVFFPDEEAAVKIPYTVFRSEVLNDNVKAIYTKGEIISGQFEIRSPILLLP